MQIRERVLQCAVEMGKGRKILVSGAVAECDESGWEVERGGEVGDGASVWAWSQLACSKRSLRRRRHSHLGLTGLQGINHAIHEAHERHGIHHTLALRFESRSGWVWQRKGRHKRVEEVDEGRARGRRNVHAHL